MDQFDQEDAREIRAGLDFFQRDIPDPRAQEIDQIDATDPAAAHIPLDDLSEGSDLQFGSDDESGVGQFKNKK